ncbi:sec-independent translocase [Aeromicrobium sp. Leaf350]|uniref:sec-independent translocase n=1 Tax=Aeromicrobium sp. Leaf350 TaxID=2876565 RepID=UPI001E2BED89|nr:sec-independent translocase [Aeromicrobium sp. Leaf350]
MGWAEIGVIAVVAMLVFGPERLPELARQAGGFVRTVKQMADNAKNDLGREIGQDLSGLQLRDLDPREAVRRTFLDEPARTSVAAKAVAARSLRPGEKPPFDAEAT